MSRTLAAVSTAICCALGAGFVVRLVSWDAPGATSTGGPAPVSASSRPSASAPAAPAFKRLEAPHPGDWRAAHPGEACMSFAEYVASDPVRADAERGALAFLPVGEFDARRRAVIDSAAEFAGIWFDLPARVLPTAALTDDDEQFRLRDDEAGREERQYRTRWFLNELLPNSLPDDAVVLLGVTSADIYPGRGWNFVFGEADLRRRVGVHSLARYFPDFRGEAPTPERDRLALLRTLKVVAHETGHAFGLEHCSEFACAMNGSNSLSETDRQPLRLCPTCLAKLAWNRGFDVDARYRALAVFLDAHGFEEETAWNLARTRRE